MKKPLSNLAIAALLSSSLFAAAEAATYKFRVYSPKLQRLTTTPTPTPPAPRVQVEVDGIVQGCIHNGGASFTWDEEAAAAEDPNTCAEWYLGSWAYTDPTRTAAETWVFMNSEPVDTPRSRVVSSEINNNQCVVTWSGINDAQSGTTSSEENGITMYPADFALCANNGAAGKYLTQLHIDWPKSTQTAGLVNPRSNLETKITGTVPGSGCMIYYGEQGLNRRYVFDYIENGTNLCQMGTFVYYRESDNSIRSTP